jgi:hypothetical protein
MTELKKLENFLSPNRRFLSEQDTLYFLAFVRKHLERKHRKDNYKLVVFYCDWALHYEKTKNIDHIEDIIGEIQDDLFWHSGSNETEKFLEMKHLKIEMRKLLLDLGLSDFTKNSNKWLNFRNNLIRILASCPLKVKRKYYFELTYNELKGGIITWSLLYQ